MSSERVVKTNTVWNEPMLLQQASQGDREAYAVLYMHYLPKLYKFIYRFTEQSKTETEDVLQEVFLKIWEKKEVLVAIRSFESYLKTSAKNKLLNNIKQRKHKEALHKTSYLSKEEFHNDVYDKIQLEEYNKTALEAIESLPEKRRQVFELSTKEDLSLDEIAKILGISKSRVKQQLYAANDSIKEHLRKHSEWLLFMIVWLKN